MTRLFQIAAGSNKARYLVSCIGALALCALSSLAYAGDCLHVKFHFFNETGHRIRVQSVVVAGNDFSWTENIANHIIDDGGDHETGGQRMNGLDSGRIPNAMTVEYEREVNDVWIQDSQRFGALDECHDNKVYSFTLK